MSKKEKKLILVSVLAAIFIIAVGFVYTLGSSEEPASVENNSDVSATSSVESGPPEVGDPGSEHSHMSFVLLLDGEPYDFNRDKYSEQSNRAHFHQSDGIYIHKHATGVTLPYFLDTLGIELTKNCLIMDDGESYCEDNDNRILMVVNGEMVENPDNYELKHRDRVLLYYGSDSLTDVKLLWAQDIPELPEDLAEDVFNPER